MKAILAVNMRDPGCGALGSVFYCHSVSQSLLGWPTFIVKALPTSSHLFRSLPEGNMLPKRLSNLGSSTCSTRLVPPPLASAFPRAQLEASFVGLQSRDDRPAACCRQSSVFSLKNTTSEITWLMTSPSAVDDSYILFITTEADKCLGTLNEINQIWINLIS